MTDKVVVTQADRNATTRLSMLGKLFAPPSPSSPETSQSLTEIYPLEGI